MIDTCTVYELLLDELEKLPMDLKQTVPINPKTVTSSSVKLPPSKTVSACEIYMCALIIQLILVTTF